ncbi:MAG: helix-turn-helix transcriptional regulator [Saprospiraceae bacterium]|nr:helix-turn-helix transcriptional regulator [Saprospiraceae bacterium]
MKTIAEFLSTSFDEDCRDFTLNIPKLVGDGMVRMIDFIAVVSLLAVDAVLKEPLMIHFEGEANTLMRFNYCVEGEITQSLQNNSVIATVTQHQVTISANRNDSEQHIRIPAGKRTVFMSIELDRQNYRDKLPCDLDTIPDRLLEVLEDSEGKQLFLHQHNYSHIIHEEAAEIMSTEYEGLIKTTHQESKALEIIAQQYKQFIDDDRADSPKTMLKEYEIEKLLKARRIISECSINPPTIVPPAKMAGPNQQKLKAGFKELFGTTVNGYLQKARFEHARALLLSGKFSVKEAGHQVGYENMSYFTRKFFERFKKLPSELKASS